MKQLFLAVYFISAVLGSQASFGENESNGIVPISPVFNGSNLDNSQTTSDQPEINSSKEVINGSAVNEVVPAATSSTVTASGVLIAIVIGVVVGAIAAAANKPDSSSSAPSSQGTINMNR